MVKRDISEDISEGSSGLKPWWSRASTWTKSRTFVEDCVMGMAIFMAFLGLAVVGLSISALLVLAWRLWPLI